MRLNKVAVGWTSAIYKAYAGRVIAEKQFKRETRTELGRGSKISTRNERKTEAEVSRKFSQNQKSNNAKSKIEQNCSFFY